MLECWLAYLGLHVAVRDVLAASCRYKFAGPVSSQDDCCNKNEKLGTEVGYQDVGCLRAHNEIAEISRCVIPGLFAPVAD